ncbi:MAG: helix-turn-helix transcriptional regulator [Isosphaeraceae bacterium]|jgi:transcriptional regulator with XRE-family HTH domain
MSTKAAEAATEFARQLRRARRAKDLSLKKLAGMMGCSISSVSQIERGLSGVPRFSEVLRFARILQPEAGTEELLTKAAEGRQSIEIDLVGASPEAIELCVKLARAVQEGLDPSLASKLSKAMKIAS